MTSILKHIRLEVEFLWNDLARPGSPFYSIFAGNLLKQPVIGFSVIAASFLSAANWIRELVITGYNC